jgi:hypothetical protein
MTSVDASDDIILLVLALLALLVLAPVALALLTADVVEVVVAVAFGPLVFMSVVLGQVLVTRISFFIT